MLLMAVSPLRDDIPRRLSALELPFFASLKRPGAAGGGKGGLEILDFFLLVPRCASGAGL